VLTRDNSAYSNHDFPVKRGAAGPGEPQRACYAQSPLRQEQELAPLLDWNPDEVIARQNRLADWALDRWAVSAPSDKSTDAVLESDEDEDADQMGLSE
jgi:hypothetical protein